MNVFSIGAMVLAAAILGFFWVRKLPMTMGIVFANIVVFIISTVTSDRLTTSIGSPLIDDLAFRPAYLVYGDWARSYTIITAAFLHADAIHLISNLFILLLAGLPFEERIGRGPFTAVYFFGAITAILLHTVWVAFNAAGYTHVHALDYVLGPVALYVPVVGASGAIFGILGGFAATYPRDEIPMVFGFIFLQRVPVFLSVISLAILEGFYLFGGTGILNSGGIAHAAHLGGAIGGAIAAPLLKPKGRSLPGAKGGGDDLDFDVLRSLAHDERTRALVERIRENSDIPDLRRAWLDRLFVALRCPECGHGFAEAKPGVLECDNGHPVKYVR